MRLVAFGIVMLSDKGMRLVLKVSECKRRDDGIGQNAGFWIRDALGKMTMGSGVTQCLRLRSIWVVSVIHVYRESRWKTISKCQYITLTVGRTRR